MNYTCGVCHNDFAVDFTDTIPDDATVICDDCFDAIRGGVCGAVRGDYACMRSRGHDDALHAAIDGRWTVRWTDRSTGVLLRRRRT